MYMSNYNRSNTQSKALSTSKVCYPPLPRDENNRSSINPVASKAFHDDTVGTIEKAPYNAVYTLNYFLTLKNHFLRGDERFKHLYPTRQTIADEIGVHIDTVQESINWLRDRGIIGTCYRHKKSSLYYINSVFLDPEVRIKLKHRLSALSGVPTALLRSALVVLSFNGNGNALPHGFFNGTPSQSNYKENVVFKTPYRYLSPYEYRQLTPDRKWEIKMARRRYWDWVRESVRENGLVFKKLVQENRKTDWEKIMEAQIPQYLREIKSIELTEAGMVRLSMYEESIIRYADEYISHSYAIDKPFEYFAKVCHEETKRRGLRLQYGMVNVLAAKYHVTESSPSLFGKTIKRWHTKATQQNKPAHRSLPLGDSLKEGRAGALPPTVTHVSQQSVTAPSGSALQEAIRKQIAARKARERKEEAHDRSGLEEFALMVEAGTVPWKNEEHRKFGMAVVERYRHNQKHNLPFENPLFAALGKATPPPPSPMPKTDPDLDHGKRYSNQAPTTLDYLKTSSSDQISFIPEDSVIDHNEEDWYTRGFDSGNTWRGVLS